MNEMQSALLRRLLAETTGDAYDIACKVKTEFIAVTSELIAAKERIAELEYRLRKLDK